MTTINDDEIVHVTALSEDGSHEISTASSTTKVLTTVTGNPVASPRQQQQTWVPDDRANVSADKVGAAKDSSDAPTTAAGHQSVAKEALKLTRLQLAGIPVREPTKRWTPYIAEEEEESTTKPVIEIVDVQSRRCLFLSGLMTVIFYTILIATIPVIVAVCLWIFRYKDKKLSSPSPAPTPSPKRFNFGKTFL